LLSIDPKSDKFVLITVVSCLSVLLILVLLAGVFLIRRRAQLRQKLAMDLNGSHGMMKKKPVDDEESLIRAEEAKKQTCSWTSFLPFIRRADRCHVATAGAELTPNQDYQELCRQRMQLKTGGSKQHSPLNSTICTNSSETPGLVTPNIVTSSSAINSTPIRVTTGSSGSDAKSESSRSSTSSW
jgi:hypothetical protein